MSAGVYNISVEQYASMSLPLVFRDENGDRIDLTGYAADLAVVDPVSGTRLLYFTTEAGSTSGCGITNGTTNGTLTITATPAATALFSVGSPKYDLLVTDSHGVKTRWLTGMFTVVPGFTPS